ncbi:hypothetical protein PybrP1_006816, partial [[Pythium] brassicae (nom. inval.)]
LFLHCRDAPPMSWNLPPVAGALTWCRGLLMGFRVISFASSSPNGSAFPRERVRVHLSPTFNRTPHADAALEASIDAAWRARLSRHPQLFNASKFRLSDLRIRAGDGEDGHDRVLELAWGVTDYKTYLGTCCSPHSSQFRSEAADGAAKFASLSRKVGVAAVVLTSDARVALIRRSHAVGVYPNMLDTPGGHPEPSHIGLSAETLAGLETDVDGEQKRAMEDAAVREFFASIVNEVHEEINLPETDLTAPLLLGVVLQSDACTPSFSYFLRTTRSADEVMALYRAGPKDRFESSTLELIDAAQLLGDDNAAFMEHLTPSARGSLQLWKEYVGNQQLRAPTAAAM